MARSCPYRREISDACNWHQDQALNSTIYILYQTGPTGFLLNEEGETKKFKVFLGDVHNCTCSVFRKEKDLCKHICWVILKKFRVNRTDPLSWQLGLNEREINQIIRGNVTQEQRTRSSNTKNVQKNVNKLNEESNSNENEQRPITETDICPICQDELLAKKLPVSFCRTCGNNVHIKCMKVWADHQKSNGETELKCPLCREIFCSFDLLDQEYRNNSLFKTEKQDLHYGLVCQSCKSTPISGKCYKCTTCNEFYLCQSCFNTDFHNKHTFVFREKINQKYRKAIREHVGPIPQAIAQSLQTRELRDEDYELLLQLNPTNNVENKNLSQIPEKVIKSWPCEKVRENSKFLNPGIQCRICLRSYQVNQMIRKLPGCKHKFHSECIDNWLLHSHPTCPIDGLVVWDPVTAQIEKEEKLLNNNNNNNNNNKVNKLQSLSSNIKAISTSKLDKIDDLSLGLIINYKTNNTIEIKPNEAKNMLINKPKLSQINSQRIPSTDKNRKHLTQTKLNNFKIEIEGKNLTINYDLNNNNTNNNRAQNQPILLQRTLLPRIESKKSQSFINKNNNNDNIEFLNHLESDSNESFNSKKTINLNNNVNNNNNNNLLFNNILNVSCLLGSKPYQLTRLDNLNRNSNNRVQSDFYDFEDDEEFNHDNYNYDDYDHDQFNDHNNIKSVENFQTNTNSLVDSNSSHNHINLNDNFNQPDNNNGKEKKNANLHTNLIRNRIRMKRLTKLNQNKNDHSNNTSTTTTTTNNNNNNDQINLSLVTVAVNLNHKNSNEP